ncbi:MAG: NAD(P)H-dependent oxidoreductase subunit E [Cyclobacteriaceae bacterium]|nr:NAD(P)H-dependent oxidoreductase subunit E [Cyclobacteriaceae bacterium]
MSKNISELSGRNGLRNNLFDKLGESSALEGTPNKEELERLADEFLLGTAVTYGAASFYDFMKPENKGKQAYVCNGSACLCAGTQQEVIQKLKEQYKEEEIGHMTCLGRCHENSAFHIAGNNYSGDDIHLLPQIVNEKRTKNDRYHVGSSGTPVLIADYEGLDRHYSILKEVFTAGEGAVLEEIKKSNLRGRGGAGFPIGFKLESCKNTASDTKFIICNADEGDPGAYSDRYLLENRPHSVLFGMIVAGFVTGANHGILYIRAEYPEAISIIENAIQELKNNAIIGDNRNEGAFDFNFKVIKAQGAYICGEETALINSIEGQRPEVRVRPPYPTQQGLFNKPTVVNNVETLAALYSIIKHGGEAYSKLGTEKSKGTKLVCLDSFFNQPGVYEVEMGTPLSVVVNELGGGFKTNVKGMQIGGPLGGIVPVSKIETLSIDFESFMEQGFLLGHASIVCVPENFSMMAYITHLFDFAQYESCGKCFPCRLGTKRGQEMTASAFKGGEKIDKELFFDLLETLEKGSLCAHGGGIPLPIKNALQYFDEELKQYLS